MPQSCPLSAQSSQTAFCFVHPQSERERGCLATEVQVGIGPLVLEGAWHWGQGGGCAGQMVRLKHMPLAQLHRALPAASCEGHVCTAGPGPCAGLLRGQVGGVEMEAWSYWVGERRGQSWGLRLLAESSGSQTVLILGASGVCAQISSLLQVQSPSALVEEWQPCRQKPKVAVRSPQDLRRCLFMKEVPSEGHLGPLNCCL